MARLSNKLTQSSGGTPVGSIQPFGGSSSPLGWILCDGTVLEQADYAALFEVVAATWNGFVHPVDGAPTVGGSQFALPNLQGLYLAGSGNSGAGSRSLGVFQNHAFQGHNHKLPGASGGPESNGSTYPYWASALDTFTTNRHTLGSGGGTYGNNPGISKRLDNTTAANFDDNETRPVTAPVNYIIKF